VTNAGGTSSWQKVDYIVVLPLPPVVDFSADVTAGDAPLTVHFTDASTGLERSRQWNFGDGTSNSTDRNPTHTYTSAGTFTVTLTVSNEGGDGGMRKVSYIAVANVTLPAGLSLVPVTASIMRGNSRTYDIVADSFNNGLMDYDFIISLDNASVGSITSVSFPSWATILSGSLSSPASSVHIGAADDSNVIRPGASNVVLATITVRGDMAGSSGLGLSSVDLGSDKGDSIPAVSNAGHLTVTPRITTFPGCASPPLDLAGSGLYMDINGNSRLDFDDVVKYYNGFLAGWIDGANNEDVGPFDYNGNGRIDFDDIVRLYQAIVGDP
jgi:PKD repeat protein